MDIQLALSKLNNHIELQKELRNSKEDKYIMELMQAVYSARWPNKSFPDISGWTVDIDENRVFIHYGTDTDARMLDLYDLFSFQP